MVMIRRILIIFSIIILSINSTYADARNSECLTYYSLKNKNIKDHEIKKLITKNNHSALQVCKRLDIQETEYYFHKKVIKRNNVCFFNSRRLFRVANNNVVSWTYYSKNYPGYNWQRTYMVVVQGDCPRQSVAKYTVTRGGTIEVYRLFSKKWNEIKSDVNNFNQAFSKFKRQHFYSDLKNYLFTKGNSSKAGIASMSFRQGEGLMMPYYDVVVAPNGNGAWSIHFVIEEMQVKILSVSSVTY